MQPREIKSIQKELVKNQALREKCIQTSREVIRLSKVLIQQLHQNQLKNGPTLINKMHKLCATLSEESIAQTAKQEYVEAAAFYFLLKHNKLPTRTDLRVQTNEYLMGLADLVGELVRRAYRDIQEGNTKRALQIADHADNIYTAFLNFPLRGDMRRKGDSIKYHIIKLEDMKYQLALREKG